MPATDLQFDLNIQIDTTEAERAMTALYRESFRTNQEVLTYNAVDLIKSLAFNTPRVSGNLAAGWWPAYYALNIPGTPNTRRGLGPNTYKKREYIAAGAITDQRQDPNAPYFEAVNNSHIIVDGKRLNYQHIQHAEGTVAEKIMQAANAEVTWKWRGRHQRLLNKYSAA